MLGTFVPDLAGSVAHWHRSVWELTESVQGWGKSVWTWSDPSLDERGWPGFGGDVRDIQSTTGNPKCSRMQ